ncbi:phosphotransferase [Streptomyces sp. NPDC055808]
MPQDPGILIDRAYEALEAERPRWAGRLRLLSSRYTAAVFAVSDTSGQAILKLHADPAAFAGETLAYAVLSDTAPVPRLYAENERSLSLLLEYLPAAADWSDPQMPTALVEQAAAVHTASLRLPPDAIEALSRYSAERLLMTPAPAWITDEAAWGDVMAAHIDAYGPGLVPLGHLDLKPDHLRRRAGGEVVLLDIETVRPDVTGLIDLVTLPAVLRQAGHEPDPAQVLELYVDATTAHGGRWTVQSLCGTLRAYAAATGLASLHGLTG